MGVESAGALIVPVPRYREGLLQDTLTFLQAQGVQGAKHFGPEGATPYASGAGPFAVVRFTASNLAEAAQALAQCPGNAYLVRGAASGPAIPYRRHLAHGSEPPSLAAMGHFLLPVDFDSPTLPRGRERVLDGTDLGDCAAACRQLLPEAFHDAACLAQATSSAGLKPGARVRLWFWCDREVSDSEAKSLLVSSPVDRAIYSPSQPIYVCAPTFSGVADPYEGKSRFLLIPGKTEIVEVPGQKRTETVAPFENQRTEPSPSAPLSAPIADGSRNATLTSVAGSMRRRGLSADAIEAALSLHNTEHCSPPLPTREVEAIARSVANYTPEQVAATVAPPKNSRKARKALKDAAARVSADPALLEQVAPTLRSHIDAGALTSVEAATVLSRAVADAEIVRPMTHAEIQATVANAPALAPEPARGGWASNLRTSDEGAVIPGPENLALYLQARYAVAWDERALRAVWAEPSPWGAAAGTEVGDAELALRRLLDTDLGWLKSPFDPLNALRAQARLKPFDPWRDTLDGLVWDGTERLLAAAPILLGCDPHNKAYRQTFAWWMISAVARTYQPGCQADHCLVLEGATGIGKTSFFRELVGAERYYTRLTTSGDLNSVRVIGKVHGPVIVELAEMAALNKRDVEQTKQFLDERVDRWQPLYARDQIETPRRCVFAGTTNNSEYLRDTTGARRFWPILCGDLRRDLAREWAPQLWAEAVMLYKRGEKWHPTLLEARTLDLAAVQEARREREGAEDTLADALEKPRKPGLNHATGENWETWQLSAEGHIIAARLEQLAMLCSLHASKDASLLSRALKALKWERQQRRIAGQAQRLWQAPDYDTREKWEQLQQHKN